MTPRSVRFGPFSLDPVEGRLTRDGEPIVIQDKAFLFLAALVERPGRLWTREELFARLWPGVFVSDDALFQAARKVRQALGDDPRKPQWVETIQGRGYRFLGTTSAEAAPAVEHEGVVRGVRCEAPLTEIIGREAEAAQITALLGGGARLVTLLGPAGAGKTTLAQAEGARWGDRSRFVDLLEATDADSLLHHLGEGLGADSGGPGGEGALLRVLPAGGLVLLDNAELCTRPLALLLMRWLKQAPEVRFLVTTRRPLDLTAERVVAIGPLNAVAGARVFRARAAARGVVLAEDERARVDDVVAAVDALPLALELAASRVGLLGLDGLLQRLREPLEVLRANRADLPERHRSIGAALELSWSALDAVERSFLAGCCVFRAPFGVEEASEVVTAGWLGVSALDLVQAVTDASLVRVVRDARGAQRLAPYVAVRELALELGDATFVAKVRDRHLSWLAAKATAGEPSPAENARLAPWLDDAAQALRYAVDRQRRGEAAQVASWLAPVMARRGAGMRALELLALLQPFEALPPADELRIRTLQAQIVAQSPTPERAGELFRETVERAAALGEREAEAAACLRWAEVTIGRNVSAARPIVARAKELGCASLEPVLRIQEARLRFHDGDAAGASTQLRETLSALRDPSAGWWVARAHTYLAEFAFLQHKFDEAEGEVRAALRIYEEAGAPSEIDHALTFLGVIQQSRGELDAALTLLLPLRERIRQRGEIQREQHITYTIGSIYGMMGQIREATEAFEASLALCRQSQNSVHEGWTLLRLAGAAWRLEHLDQARRRLEEAMRCFEDCGRPVLVEAARTELGRVEHMAGRLDAAEEHLDRARENLEKLEQVRSRSELARALCAEVRALRGRPDQQSEASSAIAALRASWPTEGLARSLVSLGMIRLHAGESAATCLEEAEAIRAAVRDIDGDIARDVARLRAAIARLSAP